MGTTAKSILGAKRFCRHTGQEGVDSLQTARVLHAHAGRAIRMRGARRPSIRIARDDRMGNFQAATLYSSICDSPANLSIPHYDVPMLLSNRTHNS